MCKTNHGPTVLTLSSLRVSTGTIKYASVSLTAKLLIQHFEAISYLRPRTHVLTYLESRGSMTRLGGHTFGLVYPGPMYSDHGDRAFRLVPRVAKFSPDASI